jgi:hypothetical protein
MSLNKPLRPTLNIEDLENGGNQKALDELNAGIDQKKLKKLVRHLKGLDLRYTGFEYLKSQLMPLMNGYFIGSLATNIEEPIYRAVSWSTKPNNIKQLTYPPADIAKLGRANNPENPMFYGSAGCHSTTMELAPNQGDHLAISKWRTKDNLHLVCAGYTKDAFKGKSGMNRFEQLPWVKQHAADPLSNKQGNQFVHNFLAREFTKRVQLGKEWQYKISAAISELILNAKSFGINGAPAIDLAGILYPSTPNEANADNVALKCHIADKYLEFVSVQYIEVTKKTDIPEYTMLGLDFADSLSDTGDIQWKNSFPPQLIAGTDYTAKHGEQYIEIVDNKNVVVGTIPFSQVALITGVPK